MSCTWAIGDVHGCAAELRELLERIGPGSGVRIVSLGDLFHRGPDPQGVWETIRELSGFEAILGNHEHAMLRRAGAALARAPKMGAAPLSADDLRGDGNSRLRWRDPEELAPMLAAVEAMPYYLIGEGPAGPWWMTHAGLPPGKTPPECAPGELVQFHPLKELPGQPFWFEVHEGPALVVFGHKPFRAPYERRVAGRRVALGLDTGCVYGGRLTAWCVEEDRLLSVAARGRYLA